MAAEALGHTTMQMMSDLHVACVLLMMGRRTLERRIYIYIFAVWICSGHVKCALEIEILVDDRAIAKQEGKGVSSFLFSTLFFLQLLRIRDYRATCFCAGRQRCRLVNVFKPAGSAVVDQIDGSGCHSSCRTQ